MAEMRTLCSMAAMPVSVSEQAIARHRELFASRSGLQIVRVPGRVNLIGEHVDYHGLPALPIAIQRSVTVAFTPRSDQTINAVSTFAFLRTGFSIECADALDSPGSWSNYVRAATIAVDRRWPIRHGMDAAIASDLPIAAGLSSSSALLTGIALALLGANGIAPELDELIRTLPDGEQVVGTRGGAMDHAVILAARQGCALHVHFNPFQFEQVRIPRDWTFLVAHSMSTAEKSNQLRTEFNARREAGASALRVLGLRNYADVRATDVAALASELSNDLERNAFQHVLGERERTIAAVNALRSGDAVSFGELLNASHASLRDLLLVSSPALDELVAAALVSGALGARVTGAGFGGCAAVLCRAGDVDRAQTGLISRFYARFANFNPEEHLFVAEPSAGALMPTDDGQR